MDYRLNLEITQVDASGAYIKPLVRSNNDLNRFKTAYLTYHFSLTATTPTSMAEGRQAHRRNVAPVPIYDGGYIPVPAWNSQVHPGRQRTVPGPRGRLQGRLLRRLLSQRSRHLMDWFQYWAFIQQVRFFIYNKTNIFINLLSKLSVILSLRDCLYLFLFFWLKSDLTLKAC